MIVMVESAQEYEKNTNNATSNSKQKAQPPPFQITQSTNAEDAKYTPNGIDWLYGWSDMFEITNQPHMKNSCVIIYNFTLS